MKTNNPWRKLSSAVSARPQQTNALAEMPFGFDTRVLARLRAVRELPAETWFKLAWRALPVGAAVLMVCWFSLRPSRPVLSADEARLVDAVTEEAWLR